MEIRKPQMIPLPVGRTEMMAREAKPVGSAQPPRNIEDAKLKKATEDFEGMLLGQMLQSMRESALGGWQENQDQSGAVAIEMAESQLAQVMASQGGLGIARTLQTAMARQRQSAQLENPKP